MEKIRKAWMPWTAAALFPSEEAFGQWLQKRLRRFGDLRMVLLIAATALLLVGYVMDRRPVMLLCVVPLLLMLPLSLAIGKTEQAIAKRTKCTHKEMK